MILIPDRTQGFRTRPNPDRERGAAMMMAILVIVVVAVLTTSMATLAMRSTRAAGDVRTAEVVKDLSNAGLAQGVTHLREQGPPPIPDSDLTGLSDACALDAASVTVSTNPAWTKASPAVVDAGAGGRYVVWFEKTVASTSPDGAVFRVCSRGDNGASGARTASVDAQYAPGAGATHLLAVFSKANVHFQSASNHGDGISVFSETCIDRKASGDYPTGWDPVLQAPAAAHAFERVTVDGCPSGDSVHLVCPKNATCPPAGTPNFVSEKYPLDTDSFGDLVASDSNWGNWSSVPDKFKPVNVLNKSPWNGSTKEPSTEAEFRKTWGLSDILETGSKTLEDLETTAVQQGNFYDENVRTINSSLNGPITPKPISNPDDEHAVVYFKFKTHRTVSAGDLVRFGAILGAAPSCTPTSPSKVKSSVIILENASVKKSNATVRATLILPNSGVDWNGNFTLIGGLIARDSINISGTADVTLDACSAKNRPPAGVANTNVGVREGYREID